MVASTAGISSERGLAPATVRTRDVTACSHCGSDVPAGLVVSGAEVQFCCHGCEVVYATIHEAGLERYYALRLEEGVAVPRARPTGRSYEELDDPTFIERYARDSGQDLKSVELYLEGVHCTACIWLVERLVGDVPGLVQARLDLDRSAAAIIWNPALGKLSAVARRLDALGYSAHPYRGAAARDLRKQEERKLLARIGVAWACAGNVTVMSLALYAGLFDGMENEFEQLFRWASFLITVPSLLWSARPFFQGAWGALKSGALHMDLPIAIGLLAGFGGGAFNTIRGTGEIYFDTVTSLIFLLLVGRWLQHRQRRQASDAAELLYSLAPTACRKLDGDTVREVPVETVQPGDLLEVRAGDSIPADGVVAQGRSTLDLSLLTGESRPVGVGEGEAVHAGTVNLGARLVIRAEATGEATRVGKLMQSVEEAARRRAPIVALADRVVAGFVGTILTLAALVALLWLYLDPSLALDHTVALLIVTCPCALGLATPLAVHAAVGRAAQRGVLVKGGDALERLSKTGLVLFDKTGTLTQGRTQLIEYVGLDSARGLIAALEQQSAHPLARAVVAAWQDVPSLQAQDVHQTLGGGIEGQVAGHHVRVGAPAWVATHAPLAATWQAEVAELTAAGLTPVLAAVDGQVVAALGFGDPLREDAAEAVAALRKLGCQVGILSGDHPDVVAAVGRRLGIPAELCTGSATPEAKLALVEKARKSGPVVMVGDGVNDAAALAAATVGISVHGGAEASLQAADVFLTRAGVTPVVELLLGARRTVAVIRRNILFSLFYNLIAVGLAASGVLSPLVAAVMMPISNLTVVSSSFRSGTFGGPRRPTFNPWARF